MTFTATPGIPASEDDPSDDQPNMQVNNDSFINIWNVNHIGFNLNNGGFHTIIQQFAQTKPSALSGVQQTYPKTVTFAGATDTQLFSQTGNGGESQMTGNHQASNGYVWCAGLLFQWGQVANPGLLGAVSFDNNPNNAKFPNNLFSIQLSLQRSGGTNATAVISNTSGFTPTTSGFNYICNVPDNNILYWFAIGN